MAEPPAPKLLSRDEFRERVLQRDGRRCVICGAREIDGARLDAHHLLERRLFSDGGYYELNGATVCDDPGDGSLGCHLKAERTLISPEELREAAGIKTALLPSGFDDEARWTKWGDMVHPDGTRAPGPLFAEASVQKVLRDGGVLELYSKAYKYPRTPHAPWSPNRGTDGDNVLSDCAHFEGRDVVASLKLDGEATTLHRDRYHARSVDSGYHPTRTWVGNLHGRIAHELPEGWRFCGENLYGQHSIAYDSLPSYFALYAIFDAENQCLSWEETEEWAQLLDLQTVPVLYRGPFDEKLLRELVPEPMYGPEAEGYVVRLADSFSYWDFHRSVMKVVRPNHVKTDGHWKARQVPTNGLRRDR